MIVVPPEPIAGGQAALQFGRCAGRSCRAPNSAAAWAKSTPCGVATCCSKISRCAADRQEREDPAAVVVQQHDCQLQTEAAPGQQPAEVVQQGDVADHRHTGPATRRPRRRRSTRSRRSRWPLGWRASAVPAGAPRRIARGRGSASRRRRTRSRRLPASRPGAPPPAARTAHRPARARSPRRRRRRRTSMSNPARIGAGSGLEARSAASGSPSSISVTAATGSCQAPSGSRASCSVAVTVRDSSQVRSGLEVGRSPTRNTSSGWSPR